MRTKGMHIIVLCLAALIGIAAAKSLSIELKWTPNKETPALPAFEMTGGVYSLQIDQLVHKRDKGNQIGENSEKKEVVPVVTASSVARFVTDALVAQSKKLGLEIKSSGGERVLKGKSLEFWVQETTSYVGTVRVKFMLVGADGAELWTAVVAGSGGNFGRSLKPINYTETFTNALSDLARSLYTQSGSRLRFDTADIQDAMSDDFSTRRPGG
jgi:hypothetical protein